ncbi:hypothetical protein F5Y09DRAFT_301897 [Xylaria sp. FL1042]|nr:hypothetical protein F5Y09DRAFT_301897 [Xylaria sp. FL1042]
MRDGASISRSTLQGDDDEPYEYITTEAESQEASSNSMQSWVINGMNRHEILRRLCIDIGHGLKALHDVKMTHGDLKPRNVLIFREGPLWIAKLCDFGLSNLFDSAYDHAPYMGTPNWRPHWFGSLGESHGIATLQEYDLAVYGALLWSVFCPSLRGKAPPISDEYVHSDPCAQFEKHIRDIIPAGCGPSVLGSKAALVRRVDRLVHGTVCASYLKRRELDDGVPEANLKHHLDERPWEHLYSRTVRSSRALWDHIPVIKQSAKNTEINPSSIIGTQARRRQKAPAASRYLATHVEEWGGRQRSRLHQIASLGTDTRLLPVEESIAAARHEATTFCQGMTGDLISLRRLHDNLQRLIYDFSTGVTKPELLHNLARLRATEAKSTIWNGIPFRCNIVELALGSTLPINIITMAWLCKGEVGAQEVRSLPPHYSVWKVILDPGVLNESERLERFLLLMQSGARIEQMLDGHPNIEESRPILNMYLHSCRLATRAVVANEICRHYEQTLAIIKPKRCQPDATKYYMTAARSCRPKGMSDDPIVISKLTALGNIESDKERHKAAYPFLKLNFEQLLNDENDIYRVRAKGNPSHAPSETTPLLATNRQELQRSPTLEVNTSNSSRDNSTGVETEIHDREATSFDSLLLPTIKPLPGWSICGNAFINELTGSVTFKRPKVKLTQLRHINIGHIGTESVLEIDMADFLLPVDPEEDQQALRQRIKKRFPLFDTAWYSSERSQNIFSRDEDDDENDDDVLATLKDDEKWEQEPMEALLSAFKIKPPDFSIEAFLLKNFSTLLFIIKNPTTAFSLLWESVISLHGMAGVVCLLSAALVVIILLAFMLG